MKKAISKNNGFTLIELIVVIAIIAILASIAIPSFTGFQRKAKQSADTQTVRLVSQGITISIAEGKFQAKSGGKARLNSDGTLESTDYPDELDSTTASGGETIVDQMVPLSNRKLQAYDYVDFDIDSEGLITITKVDGDGSHLATPSSSATPTPSPSGSATPTPSPSGSATPTPSPSGSATPTPSPVNTYSITIYISDYQGKNVKYANVSVEGTSYTGGANGRCTVSMTDDKSHTVSVSASGYKTQTKYLKPSSNSSMYFVLSK